MRKWKKLFALPPTLRMTQREYRANIDGMNIVFGAVLGFVLAGVEGASTRDFVAVLLLSAGAVVTILYLGSSPYPVFYGITAIALVALIPSVIDELTNIDIPKLQPTLAVWTAMVILIEILPRTGRREPLEEDET